MLDFTLTAGWAFLVLIERSSWKDWRLWVTTPIFFAIPTLGIIAFILLDRYARGRHALDRLRPEPGGFDNP